MSLRKPNFFIVGAPKSGTTAMYEYLAAHPQVFMSPLKEPHFFGSDLERPDRPRITRERYLRLFMDAEDRPVVGEASVLYLYSTRAAEEIAGFDPNARILMMLRSPVDMIYSYHAQRLYGGREDIADFAEALRAEEERKKGRRLPRRIGWRQGLYYREVGKYAAQVERYLLRFPREQIHIVLFDDFRADPAACLRGVLEFLEVDPSIQPPLRVVNPNTVPRSRWLRDLTTNPPGPFRYLARLAVPTVNMRRRVGERLRWMNTRVQKREPLPAFLRDELRQEYQHDVQRLQDLLKRDLSAWMR